MCIYLDETLNGGHNKGHAGESLGSTEREDDRGTEMRVIDLIHILSFFEGVGSRSISNNKRFFTRHDGLCEWIDYKKREREIERLEALITTIYGTIDCLCMCCEKLFMRMRVECKCDQDTHTKSRAFPFFSHCARLFSHENKKERVLLFRTDSPLFSFFFFFIFGSMMNENSTDLIYKPDQTKIKPLGKWLFAAPPFKYVSPRETQKVRTKTHSKSNVSFFSFANYVFVSFSHCMWT